MLWRKFLLERKKKEQIKGMISRRRLVLFYTIQHVIPNICTKFQNPRCSSPEKSLMHKTFTHTQHAQTNKHCYGKDKNYISLYTSYTGGITSFEYLSLTVPEKSVTKNSNLWKLERKKNEKGWIRNSSLFAVYMIHPPIVHVRTNFQLSKTHNSLEKCDKFFYVWKLERKKNQEN